MLLADLWPMLIGHKSDFIHGLNMFRPMYEADLDGLIGMIGQCMKQTIDGLNMIANV